MKLLGTRQVAALLGVNPKLIQSAVWDGRIPQPERVPGGAYVWTPADIDRAARCFRVKLPAEGVDHV
jgi:hypothetical protein